MDEQVLTQQEVLDALTRGEVIENRNIGPLDFSKQTFTVPFRLPGCVFQALAIFRHCVFEKDVDLQGATFAAGVSFQRATFRGEADFKHALLSGVTTGKQSVILFVDTTFQIQALFDHVHFSDDVDFSRANFLTGAYFKNANFAAATSFDHARFQGSAYFWRAQFTGIAHFESMIVLPVQNSYDSEAGQCNFSFAYFRDDAHFDRASLGGRCYFHRPIFRRNVTFCNTRFLDATRFHGGEWKYCLPKEVFAAEDRFKRWTALRILDPCFDDTDFVIIDLYKVAEVREKLAGATNGFVNKVAWIDNDSILAVILESDYHLPTFPPVSQHPLDPLASFVSAEFKNRTDFEHIHLGRARLQQATFEDVHFTNVDWQKKFAVKLSSKYPAKRSFLYDEQEDQHDPGAMSETYHDLRLAFQKRGMIELARDFYFGEMEMQLQSRKRKKHKHYLLTLFKYLSGFGKQEGLAAAWLVGFVVVLFPLLFDAAEILRAVIHTPVVAHAATSQSQTQSPANSAPARATHTLAKLDRIRAATGAAIDRTVKDEVLSFEAATFMSSDAKETLHYSDRLLQGVERLVISAQVALFLLALKWRFERSPGGS